MGVRRYRLARDDVGRPTRTHGRQCRARASRHLGPPTRPRLLIGEFGGHSAADHASPFRWTEWVGNEAERLGLRSCYWALGIEFGVLHPDVSWHAALLG
jgi:hypothetical protein